MKNSGFLQNFLTHNLSFVNKSHHIFTKSEVKDSKVFGEEQYQLTVIHFQDKNVNFSGFYNIQQMMKSFPAIHVTTKNPTASHIITHCE